MGDRHVQSWQQTIVMRDFVRLIHTHRDRDIGPQTGVEADVLSERSCQGLPVANENNGYRELAVYLQQVCGRAF